MAITDTFKKMVKKAFSIGTPPEKEVLYKEVVKRKIPTKSAEALVMEGIKNNIKKIWTPAEDIEATKDETNPPVKKMPTKKSSIKETKTKTTDTKKKTVTKKSPNKKKTTAKKNTTSTKKPTSKKVTKTAEDKKTTTTKKPVSKKAEVTKKTSTKKSTASKTKSEVTPTKKVSTKKKTTTSKGSKRDEKIALYIKDIKKHYGEVDEAFVAIVVKNLGPSIYRKDAELVSCSDPKELDTVRRNFLIKKLGINASKDVLDAAIQDVCTELKGARTKYRATFYYALSKKFKKESALS